MLFLFLIMKRFQSILYYLFFVISGIPLIIMVGIIWILTVPFDKRLYFVHLITQFWSAFLFSIVPSWKVKVIGKEKIDNSRALVFVSNHQSEFDIIVVSKLCAHFKWVSKAEVFKVPIVGWNMKLNNYVQLKRGDRKSIMQMMEDCGAAIQNGSSVFIFPEGTRSTTGLMRNMASGAFALAQREKVGIQPIVINGTKGIMLKGDWKLNFKADLSLEVLDEIPYEDIKDLEINVLSKMVKEKIAEKVWEHQAQYA